MKEYTYKLHELPQVAKTILKEAKNKILLFYADMGVGKTTLIKELIKQLGSADNVTSPTFSLVNEYASENGSLYHFDFYRIEEEVEALDIGIEEYFDSGTWLFIEWPEKIASLLPNDAQIIRIKRIEDSTNLLQLG